MALVVAVPAGCAGGGGHVADDTAVGDGSNPAKPSCTYVPSGAAKGRVAACTATCRVANNKRSLWMHVGGAFVMQRLRVRGMRHYMQVRTAAAWRPWPRNTTHGRLT